MGYRMHIICQGYNIIELGKFYGYVDLKPLKSIKYLLHKGYIIDDDPDIFNYSIYGPEIKLSATEFREFMDLYQDDLNHYGSNHCIMYTAPYSIGDYYAGFEDIYKNDFEKILEWG